MQPRPTADEYLAAWMALEGLSPEAAMPAARVLAAYRRERPEMPAPSTATLARYAPLLDEEDKTRA
jgi:hypothetical protein